MKKRILQTISIILGLLCLVLLIGAAKSLKNGSGFLFIPSFTPTATNTATATATSTNTVTPSPLPPTGTPTPTNTVTATATCTATDTPVPSSTPTPTVTLTPTATFDVNGFIESFYLDLTATAVYEAFLLTPTVTPTVPDDELTDGLMETDRFGITWVYLRTAADNEANKGFWIMQTEVSEAMYSYCVNENICRGPLSSRPEHTPDGTPVVFVTKKMAADFCARVGGALPTVRQWRKAAAFFESNEIIMNNETEAPLPLNTAGEAVVGLYGNVWEWTVEGSAVGGSFKTARQDMFRRDRIRPDTETGAEDVGFRCIRPVGK